MVESKPIRTVGGSCLCGGVIFEISLPSVVCAHCHCTQCRRAHGAAFVTWFTVPKERWRVTQGDALLRRYASSDHARRWFCSGCGSSLFFETDREPGRIDIALANLDGPLDRDPQLHVWYDEHVDWVEAADALPRLGRGGEPGDG